MSKYAVLVIGYNRTKSLARLLASLDNAYYENDNVTLIISIDNSGTDIVEKYAKSYVWHHGEKIVRTFPERQGLRNHILQCGDYVNDFDAVAIFEDDIVVSEGFYIYMKATVEKYKDDDNIAGISLYNHLWNVNASLPFEPMISSYDVYFLQFAQSWGQIWMKKSWQNFIEWYHQNEEYHINEKIPTYVASWPKTSWLKYHIKYCIEENKYFVYPYKAMTTCYTETGEHSSHHTLFQVPLMYGTKKHYELPDFGNVDVPYYDAFFERVLVDDIKNINYKDICVDLYNTKNHQKDKRYLLSTKILPYKSIYTFALELRPQEMNAIQGVPGNDIFLYDTTISVLNRKVMDRISPSEFRYRYRLQDKTKVMLFTIFDNIKKKFKGK